MNIQIKTKNLELTDPMREYINTKIGALDKLVNKYGNILVEVEIARPSKHHNKGKVFYAEANMQLPKKLLRAVDDDYNARIAVNKVKDRLAREIRKYRTQYADH